MRSHCSSVYCMYPKLSRRDCEYSVEHCNKKSICSELSTAASAAKITTRTRTLCKVLCKVDTRLGAEGSCRDVSVTAGNSEFSVHMPMYHVRIYVFITAEKKIIGFFLVPLSLSLIGLFFPIPARAFQCRCGCCSCALWWILFTVFVDRTTARSRNTTCPHADMRHGESGRSFSFYRIQGLHIEGTSWGLKAARKIHASRRNFVGNQGGQLCQGGRWNVDRGAGCFG